MLADSATRARPYAQRGRNRLIDLLPGSDVERLMARAERRSYLHADVMAPRDLPLEQVIFPLSCVGSALTIMVDGSAIESGTVGNEGFVGLQVLFGVESVPGETVCQIPGVGLTIPSATFRELLAESKPLRSVLLRYAQAFQIQSAQSTACNRLHTVDQRCARWILMTHDRVGRDQIPLTQEFLAMMLGVRRASVSVAASQLRETGIIDYHRGEIVVVDRSGLEAIACECYGVVRDMFDRILTLDRIPD